MESINQIARLSQLNPTYRQGAITIERLNSQPNRSNSYYTMNCTTLNLKLISIQKMDSVLHLVQRRLSKQKEQIMFAEFMRKYYSCTEIRSEFTKDGQVAVINNAQVSKKFASGAYYGNAKSIERHTQPNRASNDIVAIKDLTKELKTCINALKITMQDAGKTREIVSIPVKKRQLSSQAMVIKIRTNKKKFDSDPLVEKNRNPASAEVVPATVLNGQRKQSIRSGNSLKNSRQENPTLPKDSFANTPRYCLKYKPVISGRMHTPNLQNGAKAVPVEIAAHGVEAGTAETFDALSMWQRLTQIEKIEETVHKNLQIINMNKELKAIEEREKSKGTSGVLMESELSSSTTIREQLQQKDANALLVYAMYDSAKANQSDPKNAPVTSKFPSPSSNVVDIIKRLSNSLVDELVKEVSNEIADLPDAFLRELLANEFGNDLLLR